MVWKLCKLHQIFQNAMEIEQSCVSSARIRRQFDIIVEADVELSCRPVFLSIILIAVILSLIEKVANFFLQ